MGWVSMSRPSRFTPREERGPVPIVQEAGWVPGPVWTGAENLAPTAIRSPDRPPRSDLLYRLRCPDPRYVINAYVICTAAKNVVLKYWYRIGTASWTCSHSREKRRLASSRPLSARITGRISVKFDIDDLRKFVERVQI